MHLARPSMHKLSKEQYANILVLLEENGIGEADRIYAEQNIIFAKWAANKLTGIGLEVSDFYPPDEIKMSHTEFRRFQRQCVIRAKEIFEEQHRSKALAEHNSEESGSMASVLRSYNIRLTELQKEVYRLDSLCENYREKLEQRRVKIEQLEDLIRQYHRVSDSTQYYETFQEAA